ncbi:MAG: VTT domain-containing protein [Acidobacteriota bacterium]
MHDFLDFLKELGPVGVLILAMVESAGIPNPGGTDFLLLFITAARPRDAVLTAALAVVGSLAGSMFFYEVVRRGGEKFLTRHTVSGRGQRFRAWFLRYGMITVFIPAFLPIPILPFKAFAAFAAALGVTRKRFLLVLFAARLPRYAALAYLGATLGEHSGTWLREHGWYLLALGVMLAVALGLMVRRAGREALQLD